MAKAARRIRGRRPPGGLGLPSGKAPALRSRLMPTPLPPTLSLTLPPALELAVKPGDAVLGYQALTRAGHDLQSPPAVFAPTSGRITAISPGSDRQRRILTLTPDHEEVMDAVVGEQDFRPLSAETLIERIAALGLYGLGGQARSVADKLLAGYKCQVEQVVINAVESDPYVSADEALIRERAADVVTGAAVLQKACGARRCLIAISSEKKDAIAALDLALRDSEIELLLTPDIYPLGEERQLAFAATGIEIATERATEEAGLLVFNAGTAYSAQQAVCLGRPQVSRVVTLCGQALRTPKNFEVPFGTPVRHLLELCGVDAERHSRTLVGGVMRGELLPDALRAIGPSLNSVIAVTAAELVEPQEESACIRCGDCVPVCPVRLQPQTLYDRVRTRDLTGLQADGMNDCLMCGLCQTVCPSHIPLLDYFRAGRAELQSQQQSKRRSEHWRQRFQSHQARQRQEKDRAESRSEARSASAAGSDGRLSRSQAQADIAAAVARVKARRDSSKQAPDGDGEH